MNDLPVSTTPVANSQVQTKQTDNVSQSIHSVGSVHKELGVDGNVVETITDVSGKELELPREVASAGGGGHPTSVPIPPSVASLGVKPAGQNIVPPVTQTVVLPISDDQIVQGLHQSVVSSWRWLSEWCVRRLKQIHIALITTHGTLVRVKR